VRDIIVLGFVAALAVACGGQGVVASRYSRPSEGSALESQSPMGESTTDESEEPDAEATAKAGTEKSKEGAVEAPLFGTWLAPARGTTQYRLRFGPGRVEAIARCEASGSAAALEAKATARAAFRVGMISLLETTQGEAAQDGRTCRVQLSAGEIYYQLVDPSHLLTWVGQSKALLVKEP